MLVVGTFINAFRAACVTETYTHFSVMRALPVGLSCICLIKIRSFVCLKSLVWRVFHSHKGSTLSLLGYSGVCKLIELSAETHLFLAYDTHLHILKHIKCTYCLRACGLECIFKNHWLAGAQIWVVRVVSVVYHSNLVMTEVLVFSCFKRAFGFGMDSELYLVLGHYLGDHGRAGLPAGDLRLLLPQPEHRAEPGHRPGLKNLKDHKGICKDGGCVTITKCSTVTEPCFSAKNPVIGP